MIGVGYTRPALSAFCLRRGAGRGHEVAGLCRGRRFGLATSWRTSDFVARPGLRSLRDDLQAVHEDQGGNVWREVLFSVLGALVLSWLALVAALVVARPRGDLLRESLRLLPDLVRLLRNLMVDRALPRGVRVRLALLMAYLAMPLDVIPDVVPVLGYADDAIVVAAVLRSVARRVGLEPLRRHWPGTPDGFAALSRLAGLPPDRR